MRVSTFATLGVVVSLWVGGFLSASAQAMDLDWSGSFRAENHWISNYSKTGNGVGVGQGGYSVADGTSHDATFQTLFLRLRPKLVVNDNVYIKSEWWVGDPIYGFFGAASPYTTDQRQFYSTQSRGSSMNVQRLWGEFNTEVGTFQIGRAPLQWGLGLIWNSGEDVWSRYESTGDVVRLVSKFGSFSFTPSIVKYSMGNAVGGACNYSSASGCTTVQGGAGVSDYSVAFKYENPDEDFEGGVNFIKRIAGPAQDPSSGYLGIGSTTDSAQVPGGANYNTWAIYGSKKTGHFKFAGELPITTGDVGGTEYKTFAMALETDWKISDSWEAFVKMGHAPGQPSIQSNSPGRFQAFFFNPNYQMALIMFNYQLASMAGPNSQNNSSVPSSSLKSPFDNPVVNANYLNVRGTYKTEKWRFHSTWTLAKANETAAIGLNHFNYWDRKFYTNTTGKGQGNSLGWEMDYGSTFLWDDTFQFHLDLGWFFPGNFYAFSNTTTDNQLPTVFAMQFRVGVVF